MVIAEDRGPAGTNGHPWDSPDSAVGSTRFSRVIYSIQLSIFGDDRALTQEVIIRHSE